MKKLLKNFFCFVFALVLVVPIFAGCELNSTDNNDSTSQTATNTTYDLNITFNNTHGTVYGAGTYTENEQITIYAIANDGYQFTKWDDNVTDNPRVVTMTGSKSLAAIFGEKTATKYAVVESVQLSLDSRNSNWSDLIPNVGDTITSLGWYVELNGYYQYGSIRNSEVLMEKTSQNMYTGYKSNGCRQTFTTINNNATVNNKFEIGKDVQNSIKLKVKLNINGTQASEYFQLSLSDRSIIFTGNGQLDVLFSYPGAGKVCVRFIYFVE